ncbi:MAG: hypothetical protein ACI9SI_001417 [Polaribacter sp.]|jgi:hypothetical protein
MNKLFIHIPVFRFLSPFFSGVIAYLLILLINNNIVQLQEEFLSQELYVCITLSYIVHEFSRFLLWFFKRIPNFFGTVLMLLIHIIVSLVASATIITVLIISYYLYASGYAPLTEELLTFSSIYCSIPIAYVLLNLSHQYLNKINTQKLENELLIKENIEEDFKQFKREINPSLLFESFEVLLVLIKEDKNLVDEFMDNLATIYRYILASKKDQLVIASEELNIVNELIKVYNHLPYRKIKMNVNEHFKFLIVPGTLLYVIEQIIKTTIVSTKVNLDIYIENKDNFFALSYSKVDKITDAFTYKNIEDLNRVYSIYSTESILISEKENQRTISIPTLNIKE